MRKKKETTGIWAYLEAKGVLATDDAEAIAACKAAYRKAYKALWRRNKRKESKVFEVLLNSEEHHALSLHARNHKMSLTRFLRVASLAYSRKKYLVPQLEILFSIRALLSENYSALQDLIDNNSVSTNTGHEVLQRMEYLESTVLNQLFNPTHIE